MKSSHPHPRHCMEGGRRTTAAICHMHHGIWPPCITLPSSDSAGCLQACSLAVWQCRGKHGLLQVGLDDVPSLLLRTHTHNVMVLPSGSFITVSGFSTKVLRRRVRPASAWAVCFVSVLMVLFKIRHGARLVGCPPNTIAAEVDPTE